MPYTEDIYENQSIHRKLAEEKYMNENSVSRKVASDVVGGWDNHKIEDYIGIPRGGGAYMDY